MTTGYIPALCLKTFLSKSVTADFFKKVPFENYYVNNIAYLKVRFLCREDSVTGNLGCLLANIKLEHPFM